MVRFHVVALISMSWRSAWRSISDSFLFYLSTELELFPEHLNRAPSKHNPIKCVTECQWSCSLALNSKPIRSFFFTFIKTVENLGSNENLSRRVHYFLIYGRLEELHSERRAPLRIKRKLKCPKNSLKWSWLVERMKALMRDLVEFSFVTSTLEGCFASQRDLKKVSLNGENSKHLTFCTENSLGHWINFLTSQDWSRNGNEPFWESPKIKSNSCKFSFYNRSRPF